MPYTIRSTDHNLTIEEVRVIHDKIMNQKCPVHMQTPFVEMVDGNIEYKCCCEKLKNMCLLIVATFDKTSNKL